MLPWPVHGPRHDLRHGLAAECADQCASVENSRTPAFDLDSVYGRGPLAAPQLYDAADQAKFKLESCGPFEDLQRDLGNRAVARRLVAWHYHWIILHEILPSFIGEARVADLLDSRHRHIPENAPAMPVEFQ